MFTLGGITCVRLLSAVSTLAISKARLPCDCDCSGVFYRSFWEFGLDHLCMLLSDPYNLSILISNAITMWLSWMGELHFRLLSRFCNRENSVMLYRSRVPQAKILVIFMHSTRVFLKVINVRRHYCSKFSPPAAHSLLSKKKTMVNLVQQTRVQQNFIFRAAWGE